MTTVLRSSVLTGQLTLAVYYDSSPVTSLQYTTCIVLETYLIFLAYLYSCLHWSENLFIAKRQVVCCFDPSENCHVLTIAVERSTLLPMINRPTTGVLTTDRARWRLDVNEGTHHWHYVSKEMSERRPLSDAEKHFLGFAMVRTTVRD